MVENRYRYRGSTNTAKHDNLFMSSQLRRTMRKKSVFLASPSPTTMNMSLRLIHFTLFFPITLSFRSVPCFHFSDQFISSIGDVLGTPIAPKLTVSAAATTTAMVKFHSMHHRDNVIYSLRYRRMNGGVDEEKESEISEWKEQTLEKGLDQYILRGLCSDSSYHVSARHRNIIKIQKHKIYRK